MVTEGALLSLAGGILGLGLSLAGMKILTGLVPLGLPLTARPGVDIRLLAFTLLLSLMTGVFFSIIPAIQAARASVNEALKQGGRTGADVGGRSTRDALVILEVAAALVLLAGAGLMIQTMAKLRAIDLGFRADHLLTMRTALGPKYRDRVKRLDYYQRVLAQAGTLPGVEAAAFGSTLPFQSIGNTQGFQVEGVAPDLAFSPDALMRAGTSTYLQTLGVKLREGRLFDGSETATSAPVIIINDTFARHFWPKEPAIGHRISIDFPNPKWRTVIGVLEDVQERGYDLSMKPGVYVAASQIDGWTSDYLVIRSRSSPIALVPAVRRVIAAADPEEPVSNVETMDQIIDENVSDRSQQMTLLGAFAGLALLLASIGLYGVLSYTVTQRSREIGLRMALGASQANVTRLIVGHGIALTAAGLFIGLLGSWAATRALKNLLYGVSTTDPITFASVAALLTLISLAACWIPAYRASRVDPVVVLREE
jgi:predicted permease